MPRRRYAMTEAKIARFKKEGRGQGVGADYKPWLTVQDVPSRGRRSRFLGRKTARIHHALSDGETAAILEFDWADDVTDIREQFPLDRHVTRRIAAAMGVPHPRDPRTQVDIVMTTDILVDYANRRPHAFYVKRADDLGGRRLFDKMEIERRYWALRDCGFTVLTEKQFPKARFHNLEWLHPYHDVARHPWPWAGYWPKRGAELLRRLASFDPALELGSLVARLERPGGDFETGEVLSLFRWLACQKIVGFDLNRRFDVRWPISALTLPPGVTV
jgi:hypothetical protein